MENLKIISLKNDDNAEVTLAKGKEIPPKVKELIKNGKLSGGIFHEDSIKFLQNGQTQTDSLSTSNIFGSPTIDFKGTEFKVSNRKSGGGDDGMSDLERRVQNLENETQKIREQLFEIKSQNTALLTRLEHTVSKSEFTMLDQSIRSLSSSLQQLPTISDMKNTIREVIKDDNIASINDIRVSITEEIKKTPTVNDIKSLLSEVIKENNLTTETKVENIVNTHKSSAIKWIIGTAVATVAATAGIIRLFL